MAQLLAITSLLLAFFSKERRHDYILLHRLRAFLAETFTLVLWIVLASATGLLAHELPMFGPVPKLSNEWRVRERETVASQFDGRLRASSLVLTNSKTGDFLSFSEEKLNGQQFSKANRVPWSDMAGSRFPGGYTTSHQPKEYNPVGHWLRNDIVDVSVVDTNRNTNYMEQALEYTLIFEDRSGPSRLAHGYVTPMGEFRIQVQHTSTNVITSEFAHSIISGTLWDYVNRRKMGESSNAVGSTLSK